MTEPQQTIHDPERIRALAHPLRLQLIDHLNNVGEATATQCADHTGESVASCSFHLRMLAKYGYIEPAPRRGREKPWRIIPANRDLGPSPEVPGSLAASVELANLLVMTEGERIRQVAANAHREEDIWIQATRIVTQDFWATADEMKEVALELQDLASRFEARRADPTARPEGSRRCRVFGVVNVDPLPQSPRRSGQRD